MKLSTILDHIDNGHIALPEFQRGYVWNRDQVRGLMQSLYRNYPVGALLVWAARSEAATSEIVRGQGPVASGVIKLLLDGQQRITSLYGIIRGKPPAFFDGNPQVFTGIHFHLEAESFEFYSPKKMDADPLWIDVTALLKAGNPGVGPLMQRLTAADADVSSRAWGYMPRLNALLSIMDRTFPIQEVTDGVARADESVLDVVVDIFNRVNSGGTKLSKGDLALARVCASAPNARKQLNGALGRWGESGFVFDMDWLLRSVNTLLTGEARFHFLHQVSGEQFEDGLKRAEKAIDWLLNVISGRTGLDHERVFFGRYALPVMARYVDQRGIGNVTAVERDRLLYWYLHAAMWGRFSGTTESTIDRDLALIEGPGDGIERLIHELRLERGGLKVLPDHFSGWSLGARFYPVLYMLTRVGEARDWGLGTPLTAHLHGRMNRLEVHHIFPKALLKKAKYRRSEINAVANYCFLTKETNLRIGARSPEDYFYTIETKHPGALVSQWIPMDTTLWKVENYRDFLEARKHLLAESVNAFLTELLHDATVVEQVPTIPLTVEGGEGEGETVPGGIESEAEEQEIEDLNAWVVAQGLPEGHISWELTDGEGKPLALLDLAWPQGLQPGLSRSVAVLLYEGVGTLAHASERGFQCFTSVVAFKGYVQRDVLGEAR